MRTAREFEQAVADMVYAGKIWGDTQQPCILALHGWLDNAASFDALGELLTGFCVVAPDLAGHGHTSHRPPSGGYQIWDDLVDMLDLMHQLGFEQFFVVGHSRGAMIASLLTVASERVRALVQLDGFFPMVMPEAETADQLQRHVRDTMKYRRRLEQGRGSPLFSTREELAQARRKVMPMSMASAMRLITRNTRQVEHGFEWRYDDRLKAASAMKMSLANNESLVCALKVPVLQLCLRSLVERSSWIDPLLAKQALIRREYIDGTHHFHMEEQSADVARSITDFFHASDS